MLGAKPDAQQTAILKAISRPGAHVSVRAGHGVGKTAVEAWTILWFLSMHRNCRIPCTAPTAHQLFDILWAEIAKWRQGMVAYWAQELEQKSDRLVAVNDPLDRYAVARTSRPEKPEALQGFHADNLLFVIDEASGVDDKVYEVAEGALSSKGARVLMMGNPTRVDGYFARSHMADRAHWQTFLLSSEACPRVDKAWVDTMAKKYGRESNVFKVRVLGEFPAQSDDTLIPIDLVTASVGRDIQIETAARRVAGIDVARYGDDANAMVVRAGPVILSAEEWSQCDLMTTCGRIAKAHADRRFDHAYVDVIGMGAGVVDRLHEMGVPVSGVNVAEAPSYREAGKFSKMRDQLWWSVREWFMGRGCKIDPKVEVKEDLIAELTSIRYKLTSEGRIKIEGKDELKRRGLHSPNIADALCLTFAPGPQLILGTGPRVKAREFKPAQAGGWT